MNKLPEPECQLGYPISQAESIVNEHGRTIHELDRFMNGQTMSLCQNRSYDHKTKQYHPSGCGPHGVIIYKDDICRFLLRLPVVD